MGATSSGAHSVRVAVGDRGPMSQAGRLQRRANTVHDSNPGSTDPNEGGELQLATSGESHMAKHIPTGDGCRCSP